MRLHSIKCITSVETWPNVEVEIEEALAIPASLL